MVQLNLRDRAGESFNAFNQGREMGRQVRSQNALAGYDPANPDATRNALIQGGDLASAGALQNQQLNGDFRQQQIDAAKQAALAKEHAFIEAQAANLQGVLAKHGPQAVLQAFDAQIPTYQQMGADPQQLASLRAMIEVNPEAALAGIAGVRKPDVRQSGRFVRGIDPLTGKETFAYDLPKETKPVVMRDANGNTYLVDPDSGEVMHQAVAPKQFAPRRASSGSVLATPGQSTIRDDDVEWDH